MVRHIVLTRLAPGTSDETIADIYAGLRAVSERLGGASGFVGGPSNSPEGLERGYTHGFSIDFDDHGALRTYADDPEHQVLGARLVQHAAGGIDGLLVVDLEFSASLPARSTTRQTLEPTRPRAAAPPQ